MRKFLIQIAIICTIVSELDAKHLVGGFMHYTYVSSTDSTNRYKITLKLYKDCQTGDHALESDFDQFANFSIWSSEGLYLIKNLSVRLSSFVTLTENYSTDCLRLPKSICVQEGLYETVVDFPKTGFIFYVVYQRCCRNATLANIIGPTNTGGTYLSLIIPEAQALKNSAPVFANAPPIGVCVGFPIEYDHGANDLDGDSLVYSFVSPLLDDGVTKQNCGGIIPTTACPPPYTSVLFRPPFTGSVPMGGDPIIKIDPKTGKITGTANVIGQFLIGVQVEEFRNGRLMSSSIRDFQINVVDCMKEVDANLETYLGIGDDLKFQLCGDSILELKNISTEAASIFNVSWETNLNGKTDTSLTHDLMIDVSENGVYSGKLISVILPILNSPDSLVLVLILK